jgi:ferritin-like metal-binding protein YciE
MGNKKAAALLQKTLEEEKACDETLSGLSASINDAANSPEEREAA